MNRVQTSSQFNESYTYDNRSNRVSMTTTQPFESPQSTYTYDSRNRLIRVVTDEGGEVSYKYNGDGLLWERTEKGITTRYYNSGAQVIAEGIVTAEGSATFKARYIRGRGLAAREDAREKVYYLQNGHGDVINVMDKTGLTKLNQYQYDIWGNIVNEWENVPQPFKYSGEMWDNTTGLQYLRARWYDPSIGRFINEDTYEGDITNPLTLNLYTYVGNNPLIRWDPSGYNWFTDQWHDFASGMKEVHSSWESGLGYWTLGFTDPFFESYRSEPFSKEYWTAQAEIGLNTIMFGFGGTAEKQLTSKAISSTTTKIASEDIISLFRGVGPEEFYQIMETGSFQVSARGFDSKQFGLSLEDTIKFAEKYKDIAAVIEVKLPKSALDTIADYTHVDRFLFKDGTITIQLEHLEDFNKMIESIKHVY